MVAVTHGATAIANDRLIAGRGTPESDWAHPGVLDHLPLVRISALVPPGRTVVVIAPHPDDELLAAGGLLAQIASTHPIKVLGVTDGAASHPNSPQWPRPRLVDTRRAERAAGLRCLGIFHPVSELGFEDGQVARQCGPLARAIGEHISAGDVVFTKWRFDGHPDHEATGWSAAKACRDRGASLIEMPVWMWHWSRPADVRVPWASAVRLDVRDHLACKARAVACHKSQMTPDQTTGAAPIIADWALERWLRHFEVFFR